LNQRLEEFQIKDENINEVNYYALPLEEIIAKYNVDLDEGLSLKQVKLNLERYGKNELKKVKRSFFKVIIAPIINLLIILYFLSALTMWLLGEITRTIPTFIILGFNAIVAIVQQFRAEKQLQALKKLSAARTIVIREGKEIEIPSEEVVAGDIIKLSMGDKVPADCRIIETINLSVDESSLTGESEPVKKNDTSDPIITESNKEIPLQDQKNMLFLGTYIASGRGKAIVVRVGQNTELGKINVALEESSTGDIPLRRKMNNLAKKLGFGVLILLIISIIYKSILMIQTNTFNWENFRIAMINSIDLGMKVMPINLPLLTTIVLLTGVLAMANKGVIVREISSTESLGRVSVVCSDKTGTLTKNEMTVVMVWTPNNEYGVEGNGYQPKGNIYILDSKEYLENTDNVNKTDKSNNQSIANDKILERLIISGYLNNNAVLTKEKIKVALKDESGSKFRERWNINGLPTEGAILVLAKKYNSNIEQIRSSYNFIHEYSFDSSIKRMSKIFEKNGKYYVFTKGATEWLLPLCSKYAIDGEEKILDDEMKQKILSQMQMYAGAGYRVLSICDRELNKEEFPAKWGDKNSRELIEKNLTYLGMVVILDPPREGVEQAVLDCISAGIMVIMITGDNISTAKAIAKQINIFNEEEHNASEGDEILKLPDEKFLKTTVYGRVSPIHKQIIVERFQKQNRVVSMSGDGVNDALALSLADCGLAMGIKGTEVAKEAADMIITDDSFNTIVVGIREGRGLYKKIQAIIYFFVCVSVMEAVILFTASFNPKPTWALYDYWQLNFLYVTAHAFPSLGFTFMWNSKRIMEEKPRDSAEIVPGKLFKIMVFQMLLIGIPIVLSYYLCYWGIIPISEFNKLGIVTYNDSAFPEVVISAAQSKARTMSFAVLFMLESFIMPMQIRRINEPLKTSWKDTWEIGMYVTSLIALILMIYIVPLQGLMAKYLHWPLNFMYLDLWDWLIVILFCLPELFIFEWLRYKFGIIKKPKK